MIAALQIPAVLTVEQCARAVDALEHMTMVARELEAMPTPIQRIGPALTDYRTTDGGFDASRYWPAAETARLEWMRARVQPDVIAVVLGRIGTDWGEAVLPATIGGRPLFGPTVQQTDEGTLPHFDAVWRDCVQGLLDQDLAAQFSASVVLEAPREGGELTLWQRQWEVPAEEHRLDDSYGFETAIVEGAEQVTLTADIGSVLVFNTAYCHALRPVARGRRIALGMFLGLTVRGQLITWS
ncbi:2OG-Fe(II)-dependent halogenase WelO5 family protein [Nocardia tengchongensis]